MRGSTNRLSRVLARLCFAIAIIGLFATSAHAVPVAPLISVGVQGQGDFGSLNLNIPVTSDPFTYQVHYDTPLEIHGTNNPGLILGKVMDLSIGLEADPTVSLGFNVIAGAGPTNFTITSTTVTFPALTNPDAFATAAITVTDLDSSEDGATVTGLFPGVKAYEAQYNNMTGIFGDLVSPVTAITDSSNTGSERKPPVSGTLTIPGAVNNIESQFKFTLTANDSASGTSTFRVTPEPSSFILALVGAVGLAWRLRRRKR